MVKACMHKALMTFERHFEKVSNTHASSAKISNLRRSIRLNGFCELLYSDFSGWHTFLLLSNQGSCDLLPVLGQS